MATSAEGATALIAARLTLSLGAIPSDREVSGRSGVWKLLCDTLAEGGGPVGGGGAAPRARRGSGTSLRGLFRNMGPSGLYGYWLERDMVHFSPRRAESMGTVSWRPGFSGLSGDAPDAVAAGGTASALDADAAGGAGPAPDAGAAGAGGAHAPDMGAAMAVGRDFIIVPLEDALVIALLAVVQAYVRGGVVNGSFDADEVVKLIVSETALAVGRSRVVGSLTEADLKRLLVPEAHGRGGLSDALIVLGAWVQLGKPLAAPVPPTWVVPPTPITNWPPIFRARAAPRCVFAAPSCRLRSRPSATARCLHRVRPLAWACAAMAALPLSTRASAAGRGGQVASPRT